MSIAVAIASTALAYPSMSIGAVKLQIMDLPLISGDTGATARADRLSQVDYAIVIGAPVQSAVPTYSGNTATFTFSDPVATIKAQVLLFGK